MNFLYLIVGGLATYRLSLLISKENGPGAIMLKLREHPSQPRFMKALLSCEWCVSVWMAALIATYLWWLGKFPGAEWPLYWLALSAIAIICNQQWSQRTG